MLVDAAGVLRVMASSSERSEALELLQSQNDEGPCFECYHREAGIQREPGGGLRALADSSRPPPIQRGFRSVHAMPMRVRGETVGAMNLFRSEPGRIGEPTCL